MKPRSTVSGQFPSVHETDFSIMLPVLNSSQGTKVDILNLEESHHAQAPLTLGPMVVTDDEAGYSGSTVRESEAKLSRPQRVQKLRNRGHRRTASTGSNINVTSCNIVSCPEHMCLPAINCLVNKIEFLGHIPEMW